MNRQKQDKRKKDPVIILLDLIIVILIFGLLKAGGSLLFYKSLDGGRSSFEQDAGRMAFDVERNDYASLISGKYINEINGKTDSSGYHALADYVEAASLYKVYETKGYTDRAKQQKAIMDSARSKMGELTVYADKADEMFK